MTPLSQRNPLWGNKYLGFSNTYIRDYGCTITGLSMILGTTPDVVNDRLKAVNGFANGNRFSAGRVFFGDARWALRISVYWRAVSDGIGTAPRPSNLSQRPLVSPDLQRYFCFASHYNSFAGRK